MFQLLKCDYHLNIFWASWSNKVSILKTSFWPLGKDQLINNCHIRSLTVIVSLNNTIEIEISTRPKGNIEGLSLKIIFFFTEEKSHLTLVILTSNYQIQYQSSPNPEISR